MPKKTKHPGLRARPRRNTSGKVTVYYFLDLRSEGKGEIPLGTDYAQALEKWDEIKNKRPARRGRIQEAIDHWREQELPKYENPKTRKDYGRQLERIAAWCGQMTWDEMTLPMMREYLERRSAKFQANRELAVLSIVWSHAVMKGMTRLPWPAAGIKKWKNAEPAREFEVTDELFEAVYLEADQVLRDCMDIATATGMRLTDVRTVRLPSGDTLTLKASKTGKKADFDLSVSRVFPGLLERRRALKADHVMLLSTPNGKPVSEAALRARWDDARARAAEAAERGGNLELAEAIRKMFLRDMRKRAANLAETDAAAADLLQHSSEAVTRKHYRNKPTKLKAVR